VKTSPAQQDVSNFFFIYYFKIKRLTK